MSCPLPPKPLLTAAAGMPFAHMVTLTARLDLFQLAVFRKPCYLFSIHWNVLSIFISRNIIHALVTLGVCYCSHLFPFYHTCPDRIVFLFLSLPPSLLPSHPSFSPSFFVFFFSQMFIEPLLWALW